MHTCHYCKTFQQSQRRKKELISKGNKKNWRYFRYCENVGGYIQGTNEPCEFFTPSKYFWCERDHNWMFVVACLNRDCKCSQKEDVLDAIRGFDIGKEFDMKPRLVEKEIPKPRLKPKLEIKRKKPKLMLKVKNKKPLLVRKKKPEKQKLVRRVK